MMFQIEADVAQTSLWQKAFCEHSDRSPERDFLAASYCSLRELAIPIVQGIRSDLKGITVHDIGHVNQLWHVASVISGPDFEINPLEGFLLGAAFLLHDSGLALHAYEGGIEALKERPEFRDALFSQLQQRGSAQRLDLSEASEPEIQRAVFDVLRRIHADQVRHLLERTWPHHLHPSTSVRLIADPALLAEYEEVLAKICASHHWPIEELEKEFAHEIVPSSRFRDWSVQPLKLACLLRCADAVAIDDFPCFTDK